MECVGCPPLFEVSCFTREIKENTIKLHEREYRDDFYATAVHVYQKGFNLQQSTEFG